MKKKLNNDKIKFEQLLTTVATQTIESENVSSTEPIERNEISQNNEETPPDAQIVHPILAILAFLAFLVVSVFLFSSH